MYRRLSNLRMTRLRNRSIAARRLAYDALRRLDNLRYVARHVFMLSGRHSHDVNDSYPNSISDVNDSTPLPQYRKSRFREKFLGDRQLRELAQIARQRKGFAAEPDVFHMQNFERQLLDYFSELTDFDVIQKLIPPRFVQIWTRLSFAGFWVEVVTGDSIIRRFVQV